MKGDVRKARKQTGKIEILELSIAGLRVMTNSSLDDGVMVVSPKEGKRLQDMVDEATAKATQQKIKEQIDNGETAENPEEGK